MKCVIVDDEFPSREELKYFLSQYNFEITEFSDSLESLKYLQENIVDVVFLDINMPNLDGMTLGKIIKNLPKEPKIIFITAYAEYAVTAFDIKAYDYILKPYSEERILKTLNSLVEEEPKSVYEQDKITVWENGKMIVVSLNEVCFCRACERETKIYTQKGVYFSKHKISELTEKLPANFFRTHRSYIVNLEKICEIIPWFNSTYNLKFDGIEVEVPVSRNNIKEFRNIMGI